MSVIFTGIFNSQQGVSINRWAIFRESLWQHFVTAFLFGFGLLYGVLLYINHYRDKGFSLALPLAL